jgi:endoglucanase
MLMEAYMKKKSAPEACRITESGYFDRRGLSVFVFNSVYPGSLADAKMSGIEIIHHGVRTATNGDVRLAPAPVQWDPTPKLLRREVREEEGLIEAFLEYPELGFQYSVAVESGPGSLEISVRLESPLPESLAGRAGFNLEFLPSAYFEKTFLMDGRGGLFPLHPGGPMKRGAAGNPEPLPFAEGSTIVLAPEDPLRRITVRAQEGKLLLYDGRNLAQNGWFVLRSGLPAGRTGAVVQWRIEANAVEGWIREPVIAHSQVGYHPRGPKTAVIELDRNDEQLGAARLLRVTEDGALAEGLTGKTEVWGDYLRYRYLMFDFTPAEEEGVFVLEYAGTRTKPFRIAADVLADAWHPSLDVFMPVQMDHVRVKEGYRVWHGASHLDDALQAPTDHVHFDLYAQGPTTDTPYKSGEHIPGLDVGGWFDAGDFDIRTQTVYQCVRSLVMAWEAFSLTRDETTVDQAARSVVLHAPDGKPDILQQIEHGALALIAQHRAVGHAICGIVEPTLDQYTHIGDAASKTDNRVTEGPASDDRWAFTSRSTALNYGSAAALAAASRALAGFNDALARECLETARRVWDEEHGRPPFLFRHGNTTGWPLEAEELGAAVELLVCTGDTKYALRIEELAPAAAERPELMAADAVRALPFMGKAFADKMAEIAGAYGKKAEALLRENPFGVPILRGGWAASTFVLQFATACWFLHKAFPEAVGDGPVLRAVDFVFGRHPHSDISLVSGVGTVSKKMAYGSNRADFSFIAGGVAPGILILEPDFPENKEDWPFLWGENEYVVFGAALLIFVVNAANQLLNSRRP